MQCSKVPWSVVRSVLAVKARFGRSTFTLCSSSEAAVRCLHAWIQSDGFVAITRVL